MQPENTQQPAYSAPGQPVNQQAPVNAGQQPVVAGQPQAPIGTAQPNPAEGDKKQRSNAPTSTQNSLLFSEIRENMIIMNDGSFRAVVECESINFDLMSSRERDGVEYSYQNFLNSLNFPIQVLIRSRKVDISPYTNRLIDIRRSQDNMLLNVLMDDYINFVDILAQEANIMDKSFYITIPYYPAGDLSEITRQAKGLFDSFFGGKKDVAITKIDKVTYEKAKDEIKNRVNLVMSGLFAIGVKSQQLNTKQIGELLYSSYNPDIAPQQPLASADPNNLTTVYVKKGDGQAEGGVSG